MLRVVAELDPAREGVDLDTLTVRAVHQSRRLEAARASRSPTRRLSACLHDPPRPANTLGDVPADLTSTAAANSVVRRADAAARLGRDGSGQLARFRDYVDVESRFTSNVTADKLVMFHAAGEVLHGRAMYGEVEFNRRQGARLSRREAFEDLWEHGRRLLYGAVNAGGMGPESAFGAFCLVLDDPEATVPDALGLFPGNTAERYRSEAGGVDGARAADEATAWSDRAHLAVLEFGDDAIATGARDWPSLTGGSDHWIEVTRAGALPLRAVRGVRRRAAMRERLDELLALQMAGEALTVLDENEVTAYRAILEWRRSNGATITDVA